MQLFYGNYAFLANESDVRARWETRVAGGRPYAQRRYLDVKGRMYVSGDTDCTTKMNALAAALAVPFQDLILKTNENANSATLLQNAGSLTGVVITNGPNYGDMTGGEYVTYRTFSFTAMAEYPLAGKNAAWLSFTETLSFTGGGPKNIFRPNIDGVPQKQLVYPATTFRAKQTGRAVGYRSYPNPPAPLWPADEHRWLRDFHEESPERVGLNYQGFPIVWTYEFESIDPFVGVPNLWPLNQ